MFCLRRYAPCHPAPFSNLLCLLLSRPLTTSPSARSWLPLLFIPTNASPAFIFLFFVCTYFLNRPCVYCSFLLFILFLTSCNWSDRCFFDLSSNWFQSHPPPAYAPAGTPAETGANSTVAADLNGTTAALAAELLSSAAGALLGAAADGVASARAEWTGLGMEWLRSLLGRREWRIDCLDVSIRL